MYIFAPATGGQDFIDARFYLPLDYDVVSRASYMILRVTDLQTNVSRHTVLFNTLWSYPSEINSRKTEFTLRLYKEDSESEIRILYTESTFYKYEIFESTTPQPVNLIPGDGVIRLIETGKMYIGGASEVTYVKQPDADPTNDVYLKI